MLLHETEDVKSLDFAIRKETVHGILLVGEHLENGVEFGEQQQLDIALVEVEQLQRSTRLLDRRKANDHAPQAGGIDVIDMRQVQDYIGVDLGDHFVDLFPHGAGLSHRKAALQS